MKKSLYLYQAIDKNKKVCKLWIENKAGLIADIVQSVATQNGMDSVVQFFELCQYCEAPLMIDELRLCADCRHKVR